MINRTYILMNLTLFSFSLVEKTYAIEQFNFDVTEIVLENGNLFKGIKRGEISSDTGIIINADYFEYDKSLNQLKAQGNVKVIDKKELTKLFLIIFYILKNEEIIKTNGNSKAIMKEVTIYGENFEYDKNLNILYAKNKVVFLEKIKNISIFSEDITYK